MLSDPQAVTISATPISLPRLEERANTHVYSNRDAGTDLYVTQTVDKVGTLRSSISLVKAELSTDPVTGLKSKVRPSVSVSTQQPVGTAAGSVEALYDALTTALEATTKALLKKVIGGEK